MIEYLTLQQLFEVHAGVIATSGGGHGLRDIHLIESALAQPRQTFGGVELYPTVLEKAVALCFSLVMNHPFIDGNKRVGHAAMQVFLRLNGLRINADVNESESVFLRLAGGEVTREELLDWVQRHLVIDSEG